MLYSPNTRALIKTFPLQQSSFATVFLLTFLCKNPLLLFMVISTSQLSLLGFKPIPWHLMIVEFFVSSWTSNFACNINPHNGIIKHKGLVYNSLIIRTNKFLIIYNTCNCNMQLWLLPWSLWMRHELQSQCEETKVHIGFRISLQLGPLRLLTVTKKKRRNFFS